VLSRGLNDLHESVERQNDTLAVARRGLAGMRDGVILLGAWGHVLFANNAARALFGIDREAPTQQLEILRLLEAVVPAGGRDWTTLLRALYLEDRAETVEARFAAHAGSGNSELLVGLSRHDAGAVLTFVDITRLRQAERAHRETLGFLSHDLRSPIVSLLALAGGLRDRHPDPDVQETLGRIQRYAQRSLENAEQFLQMARIENEPDMQMYELDLLGAAENAAAQLLDQAEAQGSRIVVSTRSTEGIWVLANGEFIERAIANLIGNALKYGPAGDTIEVGVHEDDEIATCEVHDNGPGIPDQDLAQLFTPYFQGREHRGRRDGVGLGLRFVHVVSERHRGRVEVHSSPGEGTTFRLCLPRLQLE
jgi:signal transduction histidine kinase